jgi:hypothetical protein
MNYVPPPKTEPQKEVNTILDLIDWEAIFKPSEKPKSLKSSGLLG